jgi:hypothetical protein
MLRIRHEVVICAAIRLPDGRVFRGHRHGDCIRTAQLLVEHEYLTHQLICPPEEIALDYDKGWRAEMARDQGFITSASTGRKACACNSLRASRAWRRAATEAARSSAKTCIESRPREPNMTPAP